MFIEHLGDSDVGNLIDDGIWAEMIDDRKFFYPVDHDDTFVPENRKDSRNQWVPLGDPGAVSMDSANAYAGVHAPRVRTSAQSPNGIAQGGIWLRSNMKYQGRIVLAGDPGLMVQIRLVSSEGWQDSAVIISAVTREWQKYDFTLSSTGGSTDARLEITGLGDGSFAIGAVSLMPVDNVEGFRADAITYPKGLNSAIYRRGGNKSSGYDWRDGIGDPDLRPPRYEYAWNCVEMNDVGTHELVRLAELIEEMTITGNAKKLTGKIRAEYDTESDWTGGMLRNATRNIDYMSEHFYCAVDQRFDLQKGEYVDADEPLEDWTRRPANRIRTKAEHYAVYRQNIPGARDIPVYLDEFAYFTNWVHPAPTLGVALGYARALHEIFRHTDLIKIAGFTFATSCLSFNDTAVIYNTTGLMYQLYQSHFGTIPVEIACDSPQPPPKWPVGGEQPKVNAGGDTYPLDIFAARTSDGSALTVSVINPTENSHKIDIDLTGVKSGSAVKKWTMSGASIMARNVVGQPPEAKIEESEIPYTNVLSVDPATINIFRYELS